jgi:ribosomal-protein-alanine N-acetyltransferase
VATPGPAPTEEVVTVRLARMRWWHVESVLPIERELFGVEEWSAAMFWSELAQLESRYYRVALDGDPGPDSDPAPPDGAAGAVVVGYAGLCTYAEESWVQNIAVRRDRQGRGIGAALLDDLLAEAARRGTSRVALEVRADNVTAQRLYARRGFEAVGLRKGYYQPSNTDAVVMVREESA